MPIYKSGTVSIGTGRTVSGAGTSFTDPAAGIRPGHTLIAGTNPVQIFQIATVNSATQLTVTAGPAANIPAGTTYTILTTDALSADGLAAQVAEAIDYFKASLGGRASAGGNGDITSLSGLTTPLSIKQGGHGAKDAAGACLNLGALPVTGGRLSGPLTVASDVISSAGVMFSQAASDGQNAHFWMRGPGGISRAVLYSNRNGQAFVRVDDETSNAMGYQFVMNKAGVFQCASLAQTSDTRSKSEKQQVTGALDKLGMLTGYTYSLRVTKETTVRGAGVIAQDVEQVLPEAVTTLGEGTASDGSMLRAMKGVDYSALAALYVEAFKELDTRVKALEAAQQYTAEAVPITSPEN